jgi:hypothetical protein
VAGRIEEKDWDDSISRAFSQRIRSQFQASTGSDLGWPRESLYETILTVAYSEFRAVDGSRRF